MVYIKAYPPKVESCVYPIYPSYSKNITNALLKDRRLFLFRISFLKPVHLQDPIEMLNGINYSKESLNASPAINDKLDKD